MVKCKVTIEILSLFYLFLFKVKIGPLATVTSTVVVCVM